jgi:anaerobic magnesium-protoporphyrin IX monomethyl ester cyclase
MGNNNARIALISHQVVGDKNQVRKATPPFGIACLAAVLEEQGYKNILLIDAVLEDYDNIQPVDQDSGFIKFGLSDENMVAKLKQFSPDMVGISSLFSSQTECAFSLAKAVKKTFPRLPIIFGGNHISSIGREIIEKNDDVDFIIAGEGDYTFAEFIEKYFNQGDYTSVDGLIWRDGAQVKVNNMPPFITDMDKLPFPAFHLYDMEKYFEISMPHNPFVESGRVGSIITSRGCFQGCYYCSVPQYLGRGFRAMSAKRTIEMIAYHVEKFAIKELQVLDDSFTVDYRRVIDICQGIKHFNLRLSFPNAIRSDMPMNRKKRLEMFKAMAQAGTAQIGLSAEHGDQDFLNNVLGKKQDLDEVVASCDMAHQVGILVHVNFMMGFPFETAVNRQKTIDFARKLDADSFSVSLVAPFPNTRLWDIVKEHNLFAKNFNVNRMVLSCVNIIPHDISEKELYETVDNLNRELNIAAQHKRPETIEKYKLFKGKSASGDRKYHFNDSME